jgi:hypothetical protein
LTPNLERSSSYRISLRAEVDLTRRAKPQRGLPRDYFIEMGQTRALNRPEISERIELSTCFRISAEDDKFEQLCNFPNPAVIELCEE